MENINKIPYDVEGKEKKEKTPKLQRKSGKSWKMAQRYKDSQDYASEILKYIRYIYLFQRKSFLVNVIAEVASDHFLSFAPTQHFLLPPNHSLSNTQRFRLDCKHLIKASNAKDRTKHFFSFLLLLLSVFLSASIFTSCEHFLHH